MNTENNSNQTFLEGQLGKDPITSTSADGKKLVRFSLAVNIRDRTDWYTIFSYGITADQVEKYLEKGNAVRVGVSKDKLRTSEYTNPKSGKKTVSQSYSANWVEPLDMLSRFIPAA